MQTRKQIKNRYTGAVIHEGNFEEMADLVVDAVDSKISLRDADLSDVDLTGVCFSGADLTGADLRGANLGDAAFFSTRLDGVTLDFSVPVVPNIDVAIRDAILNGGQLDMKTWHTCETTHCRAGWAIHLAGADGYELERKLGPLTAGALIYAASRPGQPPPSFYDDSDAAAQDILECAEQQEKVSQ